MPHDRLLDVSTSSSRRARPLLVVIICVVDRSFVSFFPSGALRSPAVVPAPVGGAVDDPPGRRVEGWRFRRRSSGGRQRRVCNRHAKRGEVASFEEVEVEVVGRVAMFVGRRPRGERSGGATRCCWRPGGSILSR